MSVFRSRSPVRNTVLILQARRTGVGIRFSHSPVLNTVFILQTGRTGVGIPFSLPSAGFDNNLCQCTADVG